MQLDVDAEAPLGALERDLDVHLAHPGEDLLAGLRIAAQPERRVLLGEPADRRRHLLLVALDLRRDREAHHRLREAECRAPDATSLSTSRSPVWTSFSFATAPMSPSPNVLHAGVLLALQLAAASPMRSLACSRELTSVVSVVIVPLTTRKRLMRPGERVGDRLEDERGGRRRRRSPSAAPFLAGRRDALDDQVEHGVRAEVLGRDAAGDREHLAARDGELQRRGDVVRDRAPRPPGSAPSAPRRSRRRRRAASRGTRPPRRPSRRGSRPDRPPWPRSGSCRRTCAARRRRPVSSCSTPIGRCTATHFGESCDCSCPSVRKKSARSRSSMFTKTTRERPSSSARFQMRPVPTSTPMTPLTTTSAPSTTRSARSTSPWNPASPGTSIRLIFRPCQSACARRARDRHLPLVLVLVPVANGRPRLDRSQPVDRRPTGRAAPRRATSSPSHGVRRRRRCGSCRALLQS